jgi:hypothetical protein
MEYIPINELLTLYNRPCNYVIYVISALDCTAVEEAIFFFPYNGTLQLGYLTIVIVTIAILIVKKYKVQCASARGKAPIMYYVVNTIIDTMKFIYTITSYTPSKFF